MDMRRVFTALVGAQMAMTVGMTMVELHRIWETLRGVPQPATPRVSDYDGIIATIWFIASWVSLIELVLRKKWSIPAYIVTVAVLLLDSALDSWTQGPPSGWDDRLENFLGNAGTVIAGALIALTLVPSLRPHLGFHATLRVVPPHPDTRAAGPD